jgi:hypothetical protein
MIFDSPQMKALRNKYKSLPNYEVPEIVFLDRYGEYECEKQLLEYLFATVNLQKQKDWFGRFVNAEFQQHVGVWFEIMLYGWLRERFSIQVEPEILGNFPDFVLDISKTQLVIEAKAFLVPSEERVRKQKFNRIISTLGGISKPFSVILRIEQLGENIRIGEFVNAVINWLETAADQRLDYQDRRGNILQLSATPRSTLKKLGVISSEGVGVNPEVLRPPLSKKADQHQALRKAGYPYIIAIFLEPSHLSAEEVCEAWMGKTTIVYDVEINKVVEEKFDESGISFFKQEILHKSVTGILVFKSGFDKNRKTRYLQSWYVQNPNANVVIDSAFFPVESRFVVVGQDDKNFEMKWVN